jgi:Putative phage serine protease XkdF
MPNVEHPHKFHTEKMKRCIADLEAKGADPGKAHAICYASLGEEANKIEKISDDDKECLLCARIEKALTVVNHDRIIAKDEKRRYTLGIVYEPDVLDTDNEFAKAEDIETAAWDFMRTLQGRGQTAKAGLDLIAKVQDAINSGDEVKLEVNDDLLAQIEKRGVNAMHLADLEDSEIVESFIAPVDLTINGQEIKKGSWLAGIVWDVEHFAKIEAGEWTGYSMGGKARKAAA